MKVSEIKSLVPKSDTYELDPDAKYLIIVDQHYVDQATAESLSTHIPNSIVLFCDDPSRLRLIGIENTLEAELLDA